MNKVVYATSHIKGKIFSQLTQKLSGKPAVSSPGLCINCFVTFCFYFPLKQCISFQ